MAFSIKAEVVKKSKLGRPLNAVSFIDAAVEALLLGGAYQSIKAACYEGVSAIGIGFGPKDAELLRLAINSESVFRSDVPSFDSTVRSEELVDATDVIMKKMNAIGSRLHRLVT